MYGRRLALAQEYSSGIIDPEEGTHSAGLFRV